jgi:sugar phosphate isomerase/epimerase
MNRRRFLLHAGLSAGTISVMGPNTLTAAAAAQEARWPIGCFNRPWAKWSVDDALDGMAAAGFKVIGLLTRTKNDPLIAPEATPEYLAGLKQKIASRGLKANMAAIRSRHDIPTKDSIRDVRMQIDNAKRLNLEYLMSFGVDKPGDYESYYQVMADAAAYAQDNGIKIVLKPHGGGSGAAEEILRCIAKVKHPNFKVWYDAWNIIHYTGKDPVAELEPIAQYVTGFCAKDCGKLKGEVMIQFGNGKVDFIAVFRKLKAAGFNGPVMIEGTASGQTPAEATTNARANREFLEKIFAAL